MRLISHLNQYISVPKAKHQPTVPAKAQAQFEELQNLIRLVTSLYKENEKHNRSFNFPTETIANLHDCSF
ncbi:hypothetical protein VP01_64g7 [Puccinia sorghi]|uniref:Uncharacterized protein n=1 Tax=Puccinia sorghi TaxID=27349 RepID=A0A0L6UFN8_9BASI|nr:hypothetical protein VP01_64g7 [Puccinia sorghi]